MSCLRHAKREYPRSHWRQHQFTAEDILGRCACVRTCVFVPELPLFLWSVCGQHQLTEQVHVCSSASGRSLSQTAVVHCGQIAGEHLYSLFHRIISFMCLLKLVRILARLDGCPTPVIILHRSSLLAGESCGISYTQRVWGYNTYSVCLSRYFWSSKLNLFKFLLQAGLLKTRVDTLV